MMGSDVARFLPHRRDAGRRDYCCRCAASGKGLPSIAEVSSADEHRVALLRASQLAGKPTLAIDGLWPFTASGRHRRRSSKRHSGVDAGRAPPIPLSLGSFSHRLCEKYFNSSVPGADLYFASLLAHRGGWELAAQLTGIPSSSA
jgi:hypothetical protein